jgi:hypothetical protein
MRERDDGSVEVLGRSKVGEVVFLGGFCGGDCGGESNFGRLPVREE